MSDMSYEDDGDLSGAVVAEPEQPAEEQPEAPAAETETPEPEETTEPWQPSRDEWETVLDENRRTRQLLEQILAPQDDTEPAPASFDPESFDPYDPQQLANLIETAGAKAAERALQPIMQREQTVRRDAWVEEQAASLSKSVGDLTDEGLALVKAAGVNVAGDEVSFRQMAKNVAAIEKAAADRAVAAYKKSLQAGPGGTPYEPGVAAAGVQGDSPAKSEDDALNKFLSRHHARQAAS